MHLLWPPSRIGFCRSGMASRNPPHGQSPQVTLWQAVRPQGVLHTHGPLTEGSLASLSADLGVSSSQGKKALFPSV